MTTAGPFPDMFGLSGKSAVVTGASPGGLGYSMAAALAGAGARVALLDIAANSAGLEAGLHLLPPLHDGEHLQFSCDITEETEVETAFAACSERWGSIDVMVNAAGVNLRKAALEMTVTEWRHTIDVNLTGTWLSNRAAAKVMSDHGFGRIINVASVYATRPGPLPESGYYASKAAVEQLTRALAGEWAALGITVNCIAPGLFWPTRMTAGLAEETRNSLASRALVGRCGDPASDLAGTVIFLASDASSYITGQAIYVDGGWSARLG